MNVCNNVSIMHNLLFDVNTMKLSKIKPPQDHIKNHIKSGISSKSKEAFLSHKQGNDVFKYHRYAFIVKLGVDYVYINSTVVDLIIERPTIMQLNLF
jgi:hypothetical protein